MSKLPRNEEPECHRIANKRGMKKHNTKVLDNTFNALPPFLDLVDEGFPPLPPLLPLLRLVGCGREGAGSGALASIF